MERTYLVLANLTMGHPDLDRRLLELHDAGPTTFRVLVPLESEGSQAVTHSENLRWAGEDARVTTARLRLRRGLDRLAGVGLTVRGDLSDDGPIRAAARALAHDHYDGIVVSTLSGRVSRWVRMDVPARLRRRFGVPVIHVEITDDRARL